MSDEFRNTMSNLLGAYQERRDEEAEQRRNAMLADRERRRKRGETVKREVNPAVQEAASLLRTADHRADIRYQDGGGLVFTVRPAGGKTRADGPVPYTLFIQPNADRVRLTAVYGERIGADALVDDSVTYEELERTWVEARLTDFFKAVLGD